MDNKQAEFQVYREKKGIVFETPGFYIIRAKAVAKGKLESEELVSRLIHQKFILRFHNKTKQSNQKLIGLQLETL